MRNMKKAMAAMAVASLVATSGITAYAFEYTGPQGTTTDVEAAENGHTTFSIVEAEENNDPENVSFTVPLYVTMAVVDGETKVYTPSNYEIRNTSQPSTATNGNGTAYTISVIGMNFEKLVNSSYNTVASAAGSTNPKDIELSIGGVTMPSLSVPTATDVILSKSGESSFFDNTAKAFKKVAPNGTMSLPIVGTLGAAASVSDNTAAVAQFKVKYTVAAVVQNDAGDDVLLSIYAGDDSVAAGLGVYDTTDKTFK